MRGVYTIGVLDCMYDRQFAPDYVIGVSAGACNGISFVSGQRGRGLRIDEQFLGDPRYLGWRNLIKKRSIFGMDFIFDEIPNGLDPFDYEAFAANPAEFVVGVTDVQTGQAVYFGKKSLERTNMHLRASSSIPCFAPIVEIDGRGYLDGGVADPIPVRKALADGCEQLVVVLTRHRGYQKKPTAMRAAYSRIYRQYPAMVEALARRHEIYNDTLAFVHQLEREGRALVIAPPEESEAGRFEKDMKKLMPSYRRGMLDAAVALEQFAVQK